MLRLRLIFGSKTQCAMVELRFTLNILANKEEVLSKLNQIDGLAAWWTQGTSGNANPGGVIHFDFANNARISVEVQDSESNEVLWKYCGSDPEWKGSFISFLVEVEGEQTVLHFRHWDIPKYTEFIARCNYSWSGYLRSLKNLCETGTGAPYGSEEYSA